VLAAALARRGHDVAVIVLYAGGALEALRSSSSGCAPAACSSINTTP